MTRTDKHFGRMDVDRGNLYIFNVLFFLNRQSDITIDTRSAVPAAIGHGRIVNIHTKRVIAPLEKPIQTYLKRDETIPAPSGFLAVDIDFGATVNPSEMQGDMLFEPTCRDIQVFLIMVKAAGKVCRRLSVRKIRVSLFVQHGIMRKVNNDMLLISFRPKSPSTIEVTLFCQRWQRKDDRKDDKYFFHEL